MSTNHPCNNNNIVTLLNCNRTVNSVNTLLKKYDKGVESNL